MLALHKRAVLSCIGLNLTHRHHWRVCSCRHDQDFDSDSPAVAEVAVGRALGCWIASGWPTNQKQYHFGEVWRFAQACVRSKCR